MKDLSKVYDNETSLNASSSRIDKHTLFLNIGLIVIILGLVISLSVSSNYVFFKELLSSSIIILLIGIIKFCEIK